MSRVQLAAIWDVLPGLEKAADRIESARDDARLAHALRTRHLLQDITILDLPNEVLLRVIHFVDEDLDNYLSSPSMYDQHRSRACADLPLSFIDLPSYRDLKSFRNLRLTCRQLCELSTPLLLPTLIIQTSPASIAHLLEVSRHKLVAQGVRSIQLTTTASYNSSSAESIGAFISSCHPALQHLLWNMREEIIDEENSLWQGTRQWNDNGAGWIFNEESKSYEDSLRNSEGWQSNEAIVDSRDDEWMQSSEFATSIAKRSMHLAELDFAHQLISDTVEAGLTSTDGSRPMGTDAVNKDSRAPLSRFRKMILRAYARYCQRFREQQVLVEDGTLVPTIAGAMARMPQAQRLYITDQDYDRTFGDWNGWNFDRRAQWTIPDAVDTVRGLYGDDENEAVECLIRQIYLAAHSGDHSGDSSIHEETTKFHLALVQQLPLAIVKSQAHLKELHITVCDHQREAAAYITDEGSEALRMACRELTSLAINDQSRLSSVHYGAGEVSWYTVATPSSLSPMRGLADACTGSSALQYLGFQGSSPDTVPRLDGGDIPNLLNISSSNIKVLELINIRVRASDLETFIASLSGRITVNMYDVSLLDDEPWIHLLDVLRTRADESSRLRNPRSDSWPVHFELERHDELDELMTNYIIGKSGQNPLLPPPPVPPTPSPAEPATAAADNVSDESDSEDEEPTDSDEEEDLI